MRKKSSRVDSEVEVEVSEVELVEVEVSVDEAEGSACILRDDDEA